MKPVSPTLASERLKTIIRPAPDRFRHLGQPDVEQIRLTLSVPAGQRMRNMLDMQNLLLNIWHNRMRKAHPELSDLERTRLVYRRLAQNG